MRFFYALMVFFALLTTAHSHPSEYPSHYRTAPRTERIVLDAGGIVNQLIVVDVGSRVIVENASGVNYKLKSSKSNWVLNVPAKSIRELNAPSAPGWSYDLYLVERPNVRIRVVALLPGSHKLPYA